MRVLPVASVLAASGCLMPSPPDLADPEQTRPYIHYLNVDPPLGDPIQVVFPSDALGDPPPPVPILLPFQSEDLGEDVAANLHLYTPDGSRDIEDTQRTPASEFSTVRNMRLDWRPERSDLGCSRLTATLAHASSFGGGGLVTPENMDDAEAVSWLVNVYVDGQDINKLSDCSRTGGVN